MNDVRGSIHRRLLPFPYTRTPEERVPGLKEDIVKNELPALLRKAVLAYLDPDVHPKDRDLMMSHRLPDLIAQERRKLQRASNALVDFLDSEFIVLDAAQSTRKNEFLQTFVEYCRNVRQHRPPNFGEDYYKDPFDATGLYMDTVDGEVLVVGCKVVGTPST
jgi:phage/plasmid-associated DNA primase